MRIKNLIILLVVIAGLLGIKFLFFPSNSGQDKQGGPPKGMPSNVTVAVVTPTKLNNDVYASGTVMANEELLLQPEISGKVIQLGFEEGASVSKGQLLVKLNDAELKAQLKKLSVQAALAEKTLERAKQLMAANGISQEELDQAQANADVLKAEQETVQAQLEKTEIRAPFSGVIGIRNISEGAFVSPSTVIAGLQQTDLLKLDFYISEKYASQVKINDPIEFAVDGSEQNYHGKVVAIDPKIDPDSRSVHVRARVNNADKQLFPGSFAKIQLALKQIDSALMVPSEAVIPDLKGQKLFLVKQGKAQPCKIIIGLRNDSQVQVIDGLHAGDTVVVNGVMGLRPDAPVKITGIKK